MRAWLLLILGVLAVSPVAAQVVINRDGSLPGPSVKPEEYPALVECTLKNRQFDIEASLEAKKIRSSELRRLFGEPEKFKALASQDILVFTEEGKAVAEPRLFVQIIETCKELKEGYPIGFWDHQIYNDWSKRMAFYPRVLNDEQFSECIRSFRPKLFASYVESRSKSDARKSVFKQMLEQRVCKAEFPEAISEKRVRKYLKKTGSKPNA